MYIESHPHSCLTEEKEEKKKNTKDSYTNTLNGMFAKDGKKNRARCILN